MIADFPEIWMDIQQDEGQDISCLRYWYLSGFYIEQCRWSICGYECGCGYGYRYGDKNGLGYGYIYINEYVYGYKHRYGDGDEYYL
jgi:hypothetical protein